MAPLTWSNNFWHVFLRKILRTSQEHLCNRSLPTEMSFTNFHSCIHHVDTALADGDYELVPAAGEVATAGEVNALNAEATLETSFEPELEGKHRSITHCFKFRTNIICMFVHLSFKVLFGTLVAYSLAPCV